MRRIVPRGPDRPSEINYLDALNRIAGLPRETEVYVIRGEDSSFVVEGFVRKSYCPNAARDRLVEMMEGIGAVSVGNNSPRAKTILSSSPLCAVATYSARIVKQITKSGLHQIAREHKFTFEVSEVYGSLIEGQITPQPDTSIFSAVFYTPRNDLLTRIRQMLPSKSENIILSEKCPPKSI